MRNYYFLILFIFLFYSCGKNNDNQPKILQNFLKNPVKSILPDFSYAGYAFGESEIPSPDLPIFNVVDYGAIPNDSIEDTPYIQMAIDAAGKAGGGIVFFAPGKFLVNMDSTDLQIVKINYSNIILRGSGSGDDETLIYSGSETTQSEENSPWLSPFVFHTGLNLFGTDRFYSVEEEQVLAYLTDDALKGDFIINVSTVQNLKKGDILTIAMSNTTDDGDLMNELMGPLNYDPFQTSYINAGVNRKTSFQYSTEVDSIIGTYKIKLKQPLKRDIKTKYKARIAFMPMLNNVGIENFSFDCAYKGGYGHHKTREHDYGWGAICMHRVAHGWIRNIHTNNFTQNTHLVNSRNITVKNITMSGLDGHYGVKMYHSSDNLVEDITIEAKYTHGPGLEGCSFGNVYRNIELKHPSPIDMHGIASEDFCPPMFNLYENIYNLTHFAGGGATSNIPHSGEYNTFWGLELKGYLENGHHELFYSWIWKDANRFNNEFHIDCHKQYIRSILVGIYNKEYPLSIEYKTNDRNDKWIYVEGLNKNMNLKSIYETQLSNRLN